MKLNLKHHIDNWKTQGSLFHLTVTFVSFGLYLWYLLFQNRLLVFISAVVCLTLTYLPEVCDKFLNRKV